MNWDAIGAFGEILGSIAVLVSLFYLAAQIKSNTRQLRFDAGHTVSNSLDRAFEPIYTEPSMSIWPKGHNDYDSLSEGERPIFNALMYRNVSNFQNVIFARNEGLIDEDIFQRTHVRFYSAMVNSPGGARWFKNERGSFITDLVELLVANDS